MAAPRRTNGYDQAVIEAACLSKNRYADRYTAVAMGISQAERYGIKLYTYQCRICHGWHLTRDGRGRDGNPVLPCTENVFGGAASRKER